MSFAESTHQAVLTGLTETPRIAACDQDLNYTPTPLKNSRETETMDLEATLSGLSPNKQFDVIATNVNRTIQEINSIYSQIGYLSSEIAAKKQDIFLTLEETIQAFTGSLRREKNSIENECEWLRQQIRIILAMLDDHNGGKSISLAHRGVVFNDESMYQQGYREEVKTTHLHRHSFYDTSPFNLSAELADGLMVETQMDPAEAPVPPLSLLQLKTRLNEVFLDVLKLFVGQFQKLTELNLAYADVTDALGDVFSPEADVTVLRSLPTKEQALEHKRLIGQFESTVRRLSAGEKWESPGHSDKQAFIILSPRKARMNERTEEDKIDAMSDGFLDMDALRDVNYRLVREIRGLQLTKITPLLLSSLQKEVDFCEAEAANRALKMRETIITCLSLIKTLCLLEEQLLQLQKQYDAHKHEQPPSEGYFDSDTLRFVQNNPREFGLMEHHLGFVGRLAHVLQRVTDARQKKHDHYANACRVLWAKLGEPADQVEAFLAANAQLTEASVANLKAELARLYAKRSQYIERFIVDARKDIETSWSKMLYSRDQRMAFEYYAYDVASDNRDKEAVLNEHEKELARLQQEFSEKQEVLELYSQLQELLADQKFLTESLKDSSRLLSKNLCKILLNEEKIRKKIHKSMPRVIATLKQQTIAYNDRQLSEGKRPLLIHGEDLFEKVLILEANQGQQNMRGRPKPRPKESPKRSVALKQVRRSTRLSPIKVAPVAAKSLRGKSPTKKISPGPVLKGRNVTRSGSAGTSEVATRTNLSTSTLDSPLKTFARSTSALSKLVGTHLQPLNSPLTYDTRAAAHIEPREDHTFNLSRVSPLRINHTFQNAVNTSGNSSFHKEASFKGQTPVRISFSPIKGYDFIDGSFMEDKENTQPDQYGLSPIRVVSNENRQLTGDLSVIIGDDYQAWRDERIRQLNGIH